MATDVQFRQGRGDRNYIASLAGDGIATVESTKLYFGFESQWIPVIDIPNVKVFNKGH
jgi:hypothetical protein